MANFVETEQILINADSRCSFVQVNISHRSNLSSNFDKIYIDKRINTDSMEPKAQFKV